MKKKRLVEVATIQAGYPFRGSIPADPAGPIKVIQTRDLHPDSEINWEQVMRTGYPGGRSTSCLKTGDILFLSRGEKLLAKALIDVPAETICSPHFFVIRPLRPKELLPAFLSWQINQAPSQQYLHQAAEGSRQQSVRRSSLENLVVVIPDLAHQMKLLKIADLDRQEREIFARIIANRQQHLHALMQGLLDDAEEDLSA